jgi:hypothetical protein
MFKRSDHLREPRSGLLRGILSRASVLALLIPVSAMSGVSTIDTPETAKPPPAAPKAAKAQAGYQIRCWQEGRLLFEENHIALPVDGARYAVRMSGTDRNGKPLYVVETTNATCLVRSASDVPAAWH